MWDQVCSSCHGSGQNGAGPCKGCGGSGIVRT
jgi:DnaJ-class molecular chaperone